MPQFPDSSAVSWSVVVPVRDEAGNIGPLTEEILAAMSGYGTFEIILVDDGSRDGTAQEIADVQSRSDAIRSVTHRASCGQSQALITGVMQARAPWIVTLDGDGQNDPADISALISAWQTQTEPREASLIIGQRDRRQDGLWKIRASYVARLARRIVLADATPDSGCGLKLFAKEMFLALPQFDALHRFIPALVRRTGGSVISVPVGHRARRHGRSKYGIVLRGLVGLIDLIGVWWLNHRYARPVVVKKP